MEFAAAVGETLRRARTRRGFSLREVASRSGSRFGPSSVASYERGERAISLERFRDLAELYDESPVRLLDEIVEVLRRAEREPDEAPPEPTLIVIPEIEDVRGPNDRD